MSVTVRPETEFPGRGRRRMGRRRDEATMTIWVITDPKCEIIYGTVEAEDNLTTAAQAVDDGQASWFGQAEPGRQVELAVHLPFTLADGIWRELAPAGAGVHGQCGGDVQVTEAYSRRFALIRPDLTWAVVTYAWYAINESAKEVTDDTAGEVVEQQVEFLIVEDPHDLNRYLWEDLSYEKEYDPEPTEQGVLRRAQQFRLGDIYWNGLEFR